VLCDFAAADHQLLVFTCHEHILQLFKLLDAEVTELPPSGEEPARLTVHKPTAAARRPKRKVRPESEPQPQPLAAEMARADPPAPPKPEPRIESKRAEPPKIEGRRPRGEVALPQPPRPVRPAAEEQPSRRGRLVPWDAPWGEQKPKEQPSVFVNERNELEYVDSDAEPLDYTHQPADGAADSDDDPLQDDEEEDSFDPEDDPDFGPDFPRGYEDEQGYLDARGDAEAA
jgi:hypothetical protein